MRVCVYECIVVVDIDDVSELSYALLRQPNYTSWFVMTDHKASYFNCVTLVQAIIGSLLVQKLRKNSCMIKLEFLPEV